MTRKNEIHIPANILPYPEKHEITAAGIIADYFSTDVYFKERGNYKSADFMIDSTDWELKSPMGNGKRTIQHALQAALKQSTCIVIDARRSKMHINKIQHELRWQYSKTRKIKRLLLITKTGKIIELQR